MTFLVTFGNLYFRVVVCDASKNSGGPDRECELYAPSFDAGTNTKMITVVVPPYDVHIVKLLNRYSSGQCYDDNISRRI